MNGEIFNSAMQEIDRSFQEDNFNDCLPKVQKLRAELASEAVVDANMIAWAVYYELRTLHALKNWAAYVELMEARETHLFDLGPVNHAYACSLMMEALARNGNGDQVPDWGAKTCGLRIKSNDPDAFEMAIDTTLTLLDITEREDLRSVFFRKLADEAKKAGLEDLQDKAIGWAAAEEN